MDHKLTDEQISELCMFMRVSDLLRENKHLFKDNHEFMKSFQKIQANVNEILESLSPEEIDEILEEHKLQLDYLAKTSDKHTKKKKA